MTPRGGRWNAQPNDTFRVRVARPQLRGPSTMMAMPEAVDPTTGAATAAAGQVQVSVESAVAALDPRRWELIVAQERPRPVAGTGVDAVIRARRLS
jgi:hypothetical protein